MARKLIVELIADPRGYTAGLQTAAKETKVFGAEMDKATRGILTGTGAIHGLGRSLAFASGGFLAFAGASKFLEDSVSAARDAGVAQRSLAAQMKASGDSFTANQAAIQKASLSLEKFGFTSEDSEKALTVLERGTGNITRAISLQGVAANLARAKNIDLASAANVLAKVFGGQETALRRAVPGLDKHAHGLQLIAEAQQRLAGQAKAGTTEVEKFHAILHNTEVIVGTALLPTLNKFLESLGKWLDKMNRSGRLQKDVNDAVKTATGLFHDAKAIVEPLAQAFKTLGDAVGGTRNEVKLLVEAFAGFKVAKWVTGLASIGTTAATSAGEVGALRLALGKLAAIGVITVEIELALNAKGFGEKVGAAIHDAIYGKGQSAADLAKVPKAKSAFAFFKPAVDLTAPDVAPAIKTGKLTLDQLKKLRTNFASDFQYQTALTYATYKKADADAAKLRKYIDSFWGKVLETVAGGGSGVTKPGASVQLQNTWFDNMIQRQLGRVQDIQSVAGQVTRLQQISAEITKRISVTHDITRKLNLEDQQLQVLRQIKQARQQAQQDVIDALSLNVARAGLTQTVSDDIAALQAVNAKLAEQQKQLGYTRDREQQIISNELQIQQLQQQAAQAAKDRLQTARDHALAVAQLAVTMAQATPGYQDDLATQQRLVEILRKQLAADRQNVALQQQLFDAEQAVQATLKQRADAASQAKIDAGNLAIQRAQLTDSLTDDLAATIKQVGILKAQHASASDIVAALLAVKNVRQQIAQQQQQAAADAKAAADAAKQRAKDAADAALAARNAKQFGILGLGPTGGALVPGVANLTTRLASIRGAVKGTFLDTGKTGSELDHIAEILSGKFGSISESVRSAIDQMYKDINDKLKSHQGDQTTFQHISSQKFVDSLGLKLTPAQKRVLEAGVSTIGAGGTVPSGRAAQFTAGTIRDALTHGPAAAAAARAGRRGTGRFIVDYGDPKTLQWAPHPQIVINGGLNLHGVQDVPGLEQEILRRAKARPHTRRGT